ncbi:hypothetical protein BDR07DRAFT_1395946 [Suillus spraguei]|nr:hypothetical protein BDR07DRAFT_1403061 [Suillus spraguei]KAG2366426.1 hypothetical protein BDR07DRAFT_1395946 [Suillus spraguei]
MALPNVNRMYLTGAWLESLLYGVNCVLFGLCMYALFSRHKPLYWLNALACIFHFTIATAHNIISLVHFLQAFTDPAIISVPDGSIIFLLSNTALTKAMGGLFLLNSLALNLLLTWRLYVVWNHRRILAFVMLFLVTGWIATGIANWVMLIAGHTFSKYSLALARTSCSLDLVLTISITSGIAYRLWRAGREVVGLTGHHAYKAAIYTIIESGAIYTSSIVVVCAMYQAGSPAFGAAINVDTQIVTLTPLFLTASVTLNMMHKESVHPEASTSVGPAFASPIQVTVTKETHTHPIDTTDASTQSTEKSQITRAYHDNV